MQKKNKLVGLMIEDIFTDFAEDVIKGAVKAIANCKDHRLVVIGGKFFDGSDRSPDTILYKSVYNTIYKLGALCSADGLLLHLGSMDEQKNSVTRNSFLRKYKGIPKVFISSGLKDQVTVCYDNKPGIDEMINGFTNINDITSICMLGGRDDNHEARLRKKLFIDCLKANGIMFREKMYEPTDMSSNTEEAAERLLDRNPDVKAIFCVNDGAAVGLYKVMEKRRLVPGRDIVIVGFDNTRMASNMKPSLTSIGPGSVPIGHRAAEMLIEMINGEDVHSELISTRLYGRASYRYTTYQYSIRDLISANSDFIYRMFDDCFYRYSIGRPDRYSVDLRRLYCEFISRILNAMNRRYLSIEDFVEIGRLIDIFFDEGAMEYTDSEKLLESINLLQDRIVQAQRMKGAAVNTYINRLFLHMKDKAITVLTEKNIRDNAQHRSDADALMGFIVKTSYPVSGKSDLKTITDNFADLGINNAGLFLFSEPVIYEADKEELFPEYIDLLCVMKKGESHILPKERRKCRISEIFTRGELSSECTSYVTFPVFFRDIIYGFLVCEISGDICNRGEFIAVTLGHALYLNDRENETDI